MARKLATAAILAMAAVATARAGDASGPPPGFEAPVLVVDRFSDAAGTLLRRSGDPTLPKPGEAIDFDRKPFVVPVQGPDGRIRRCYNLDARPAKPSRYYVFFDVQGNYQLGQFPVVDAVPGDPGYSDLWDLWKVIVPASFHPESNSIRDRDTVERLLADPASGYTASRTGVLLNGPIVPEGSRAAFKADGRPGSATLLWAWYRGKRVPYLYFEGSIPWDGEVAPVADGSVALASPAVPETIAKVLASSPPALKVVALPKAPGYSPLRRLVGAEGTAMMDGLLNCPIVGPVD